MIDRLIRLCATNRFATLTIVAALVFAGLWSMNRIALDALPDLSDTQVIIYSKWDRSPDIIEDQVTYPIITALLGAPPDARVPLQDPVATAPGRADGARSRCHRRRLGLPVRARRQERQALPGRPALAAGLAHPL